MSYVLITSQERRLFKSRYSPQCCVIRPLRGVKGNETLLLPSPLFISSVTLTVKVVRI